jgi:hypothetical protein
MLRHHLICNCGAIEVEKVAPIGATFSATSSAG